MKDTMTDNQRLSTCIRCAITWLQSAAETSRQTGKEEIPKALDDVIKSLAAMVKELS
jgi:hypothetical protein